MDRLFHQTPQRTPPGLEEAVDMVYLPRIPVAVWSQPDSCSLRPSRSVVAHASVSCASPWDEFECEPPWMFESHWGLRRSVCGSCRLRTILSLNLNWTMQTGVSVVDRPPATSVALCCFATMSSSPPLLPSRDRGQRYPSCSPIRCVRRGKRFAQLYFIVGLSLGRTGETRTRAAEAY